jgi:rubrerythrin
MPNFNSPFSGVAHGKKLTQEELVRAVRFLVASEYEATQMYMQLAESTDHTLSIQVLKDIANEEIVHAGELLRLLYELAPEEAKLYTQGAKEVEEKIARTRSPKASTVEQRHGTREGEKRRRRGEQNNHGNAPRVCAKTL